MTDQRTVTDQHAAATPRPGAARAGIGLVEVILAMTILAIVLTSLAALTFTTAERARHVTDDAYRQAALIQHMNRFMALPYDSIAGRVGCATVSTGNFPHEVCVTGTASAGVTEVQVKVTPTRPGMQPDSVTFERVRMTTSNPLST
ncbi:MAG: hypothetical protein WEB88_07705 [Gemmatimonadota bacterium]